MPKANKASATATVYAAVRQGEHGLWIESDTTYVLASVARENADKTDKLIPEWAKVNPVVRIGKFKMVELPD